MFSIRVQNRDLNTADLYNDPRYVYSVFCRQNNDNERVFRENALNGEHYAYVFLLYRQRREHYSGVPPTRRITTNNRVNNDRDQRKKFTSEVRTFTAF